METTEGAPRSYSTREAVGKVPVIGQLAGGPPYTSLAFGKTLRESGLAASMGSRGDAYDYAACESCISTLKRECIKRHRYTRRYHARLWIFQYIETFYNPRRRYSALEGISSD